MFQSDTPWDVDKAAESLNVSLFGKSKKKRKAGGITAQEFTKNKAQSFSSIIHDSDDETFTKKGKKKLKERRRRKNKHDKKSNSESLPGQSAHLDEQDSAPVISVINKKKQKAKKTSKQKLNPGKPDTSAGTLDLSVDGGKKRKRKKQKTDKESNSVSHESVPPDKANKKKRKRSQSEHPDTEDTGNKKMKIDQNKITAKSPATDSTAAETRKRKRNRKKKNNSKKNKYKHLALNSKANALDSSTADNITNDNKANEIIASSKLNDGQHSQKSLVLGKGSKKCSDGKTMQQAVSLQDLNINSAKSPAESILTKKKNQQKIHPVNGTPLNLQAKGQSNHKSPKNTLKEKKNKKRKHDQVSVENSPSHNHNSSADQENEVQPPKKKKRKKNKQAASGDKVANSKSESQTVNKTGIETKDVNTPNSKALQKTNLKQHILVKMLSGLQTTKTSQKPGQKTPEIDSKKKKKNKIKQKSKELVVSPVKNEKQLLSLKEKAGKSKNKNDKGNKKEETSQDHEMATDLNVTPTTTTASPAFTSLWGKAAELGQQAKDKLDSARFRYINEQLYSCKGNEALKMFKEDREAFSVYHQGFENQVNRWPVNPLNVIVKQIKEKPDNLVIADFGCGDAKLAASVPQKVHSFDLVALNKRVTVCDMSKTPLPSEKVDIAVFCLSLMGTNIGDYIHEACRILKPGGLLKIAEVVSRFSGVSRFIDGVCSHGFQLLNKRDLSQMFYLMDFRKVKTVKKLAATEIKLKPCVYKRR